MEDLQHEAHVGVASFMARLKTSPRKTAAKAKAAVSKLKQAVFKSSASPKTSDGAHHKPLSHDSNDEGWKSFVFKYEDREKEHMMIPHSAKDTKLLRELRRLKESGVLTDEEFYSQCRRVKER